MVKKESKGSKSSKSTKGTKGTKSTTSRKKCSKRPEKWALDCNSGKNSFGGNVRVTAEVKKLGDEKRLDRVVVKWMVNKKRI